jgi:D-alanyl-lipoteichoic acid acyltransferase DltB (MBOAT superfamily)
MYRNIFLTMLLGGLWHGSAWTFVIWGAIHGSALVIERFVKGRYHEWRASRAGARELAAATNGAGPVLAATAGWLMTFHLFTVAAVFFRSPELDTATRYFAQMVSFSGEMQLFTPFLLLLTAGAVAVQFLPGDGLERMAERMRGLSAPVLGLILGIGLLAIDFIGPDGVAPFVYFQF